MSKSPQHQDMGKQMLQPGYSDKAEYSQWVWKVLGWSRGLGQRHHDLHKAGSEGRALWERSCCEPLDLMLYL